MKWLLTSVALLLIAGTGGLSAQVGHAERPQAPLRNVGAQSLSSAAPPPSAMVQLSGVARTSTNAPVPYATVRLRDAQTGRIVGTANADQAGQFSFGAVRPGYYVVEVVNQYGNVLATSPLIDANAGDIISTLVKLPARIVPGGFLGGASSAGATAGASTMNVATIVAVVSAAASAGVLAVAATRPVSPEH